MKKLFLILFAFVLFILPGKVLADNETVSFSPALEFTSYDDIADKLPLVVGNHTVNDYLIWSYQYNQTTVVTSIIYFNVKNPEQKITSEVVNGNTFVNLYTNEFLEFTVGDVFPKSFSSVSLLDYASLPQSFNSRQIGSSIIPTILLACSRDIYDPTGTTILFPGTNSTTINSNYNVNWYANNQESGPRIIFDSPGFSVMPISAIQNMFDFQFATGSNKNVFMHLENPDIHTVPKIVLKNFLGEELDEYAAIVPGTSINGYIEYFGSNKFKLHFITNEQFSVWYDTTDNAQVTHEMINIGTSQNMDPNYISPADSDRNVFCAAMPHEITTWLGNISFPLDNLCSMILPPKDYLPKKFSFYILNFENKLQFIPQTISLLTSLKTSLSSNPVAPTFPAFSIYGVNRSATNLSLFSPVMTTLRIIFSAVLWIWFIVFLFRWVKGFFSPDFSVQDLGIVSSNKD